MPADLGEFARASDRINLARHLFDAIGKAGQHRSEFDVLLLYLPPAWAACFEAPGFDLHDFLKAYCAPTNIPIQILLESALRAAAAQMSCGALASPSILRRMESPGNWPDLTGRPLSSASAMR